MKQELFKQYAIIKSQIKLLEEQAKELQPALMAEFEEANTDTIESDDGLFTVNAKKNWIYTEAVQDLELQVKEKQAEEKATGLATYDEVKYLVFKSKLAKQV